MIYRIVETADGWQLLRNGAIVGTWHTKAEAKLGRDVERRRRGDDDDVCLGVVERDERLDALREYDMHPERYR